jgi:uncharacterized protein (TIGR03435 family)
VRYRPLPAPRRDGCPENPVIREPLAGDRPKEPLEDCMKMMAAAAGLLLFSALAFAQAPARFEVASVRPSADDVTQAVDVGVKVSGSQVRISSFSLKDYIATAFDVKAFQVSGPDWLGQVRYDVAGKIPEGGSDQQVGDMLRNLLEDRFALKIHREQREFPVYALIAADGGPKLKPLAETPDAAGGRGGLDIAASGSGRGVYLDMGGGSSFTLANNKVEIRRMTLAEAADMLERFVDRPMIDATGVTGRYDITLDLTQEDYMAMLIRSAVNAGLSLPPQAMRMLDGAATDPLSASLQKVGLRLDSRRASLGVIVVDEMQKAPTEN